MSKETLFHRLLKFYVSYISAIPTFLFVSPFFHIYDWLTLSSFGARSNSPSNHRRKVERVQRQVKSWNAAGRPNRMCTARKAWQTLSVHNMTKKNLTQIDVELNDIVEVNVAARMLIVEPGMMMGKLSSVLLPKGWTIPIVPEFETLTIGGVICGTGIETSSNAYGLSSDICVEYEVVLATGEVVNCSKDEHSDLFHAIPWSHGTLGFLTAVKIPLIPAKKYVRLEYFPIRGSVQAAKKLLETTGHDFVEGIMFGLQEVVVMHGDQTDDAEYGKVNHINRWYKPWFFKHVESFLYKPTPRTGSSGLRGSFIEYIPLREYYHRHTRGFFWETMCVLPYGNSFWFRLLMGWIYPLNFQLLKLLAPIRLWEVYYQTNHVLQDFMVPMAKLESSLEFLHKLVEIYPLWLCPCKFFNKPGMVHSSGPKYSELYIDIGIYGDTPKKAEFEPEKTIRQIEQFALQNQGVQFLYADSYLSREEFNRMFDRRLYEKVRAKYECQAAFPDVYDKVSRHARRIQVQG